MSTSRMIAASISAGAMSGLLGALTFAALHALLIVPIWNRMTSGLLFGVFAGAVAGWAMAELRPDVFGGSARRAVTRGAGFGAILWLLVAPVSFADALLRWSGVAPRLELVAVGVALVLAVSAGGFYGWRLTGRRRGAVAGAAATLALTIAMAGPVPIARSPRAFSIFIAVLPAAVIGGAATALIVRMALVRLERQNKLHKRVA